MIDFVAENGFPPEKIKVPTNPPQNSDIITFLLLMAMTTATIGGSILKKP